MDDLFRGSPALAGIDLLGVDTGSPTVRFPRTRGDRPIWRMDMPQIEPVPPHSRG